VSQQPADEENRQIQIPSGQSQNRPPQRSPEEQVNVLRGLYDRVVVTFKLMFDGRVSFWAKLVPLLSLVYLLVPIDLLPEIALGPVGAVDDVTIIAIAFGMFMQIAPPDVVREHLRKMGSPLANQFGSTPDYGDDDIVEGTAEYTDE